MAAAKVAARRAKHKSVEYGRWGYIFIAPFFLVYLVFQLWPLISTFYLSVFDIYERNKKIHSTFCGFDNFVDILGFGEGQQAFDTFTVQFLGNTVIMWLVNFLPQILMSLLLAVWLTDTKCKIKGQGAFKVLIYMPNIITAASISVLFYSLFSNDGPITNFLKDMGLIAENFFFMESIWGTRGIISFILFWMWYGNTMLLLISGILGINPSLFEAADIDGCTGFKKFLHVTLPMLKPIMLYVLVTSAIGGLQSYDIPGVFNVTMSGEGLPGNTSTTITMYIRNLSTAGTTGKAAAVSVLLFIITVIISLVFFFFLSDREKKPKKRKGVA